MKKTKVLIVDDSDAVRDGLRSILSAHTNIEIVGEALNGLDAITGTSDLHPDIILMDDQMPGMNGVEAALHVKERFPGIKVLLLAVHKDCIEEALAAGVDGYLMKDCQRGELLQMVRALSERPDNSTLSHLTTRQYVQ